MCKREDQVKNNYNSEFKFAARFSDFSKEVGDPYFNGKSHNIKYGANIKLKKNNKQAK